MNINSCLNDQAKAVHADTIKRNRFAWLRADTQDCIMIILATMIVGSLVVNGIAVRGVSSIGSRSLMRKR
jgi:hypothetical protein